MRNVGVAFGGEAVLPFFLRSVYVTDKLREVWEEKIRVETHVAPKRLPRFPVFFLEKSLRRNALKQIFQLSCYALWF